MQLGLGLGFTRGAVSAGGVAPPQVIDTDDYELAISVDPGGGTFTLSISVGGTPVSGSPFTVTAEQLSADEHCLRDVAISGTGTVGQTLTAATGLWIGDPALSLSISRQWFRGATPISGATGLTYTLVAGDAGQSITCKETVGTTTVTSNAIAVAALPSLTVARIGDFQSSSTLTASPSFTVDLTGYNAGDQIVFTYSMYDYASAATVGGAAATKLGTDPAGATSGRQSAFSYTLTATGGPGTVITLTLPVSRNAHVFSCHGIKGGTVSAVFQGYHGTGAPVSTSLDIAANDSHVIAVTSGELGANPITWTGVTGVASATVPIAGGNAAIALAEASGVAAPSLSVASDASGSNRTGVTFVAIQPS